MNKIILSLAVSTSFMYAEGTFSVGHKHFSLNISQDGDYTVLGGNINTYVVDNLSVGAGITAWLGDKPTITSLTVPVTYYMPLPAPIRPYVGVFASYTFVGDDGAVKYENYSSYGGRVGIVADVSPNMYTYAGWVQVKRNGDYVHSDDGYPEFGFGMSF